MNIEKLEQARVDRGVMYKFIAERCGMQRSLLCKRMHGRGKFTVDEARDIALALRLTYDELNEIFFDGKLPETQLTANERKRARIQKDQ